jgi:nucleoside-diphosphate-sugar epimerase
MRIFVTGASGFIGGAIASRLAGSNEVVALSRSPGADGALRARGAQPVRGDLEGVGAAQLAGCEAVVHCAAWVEPWGRREDFWRVNVEGTSRLLAAAREAGVRRFVHMSTEAVLWRGQPLRDIDESHPYPARTPFLYAETKAEAERRVLAANDLQAPFETVVLRPRFVWGPGDRTIVAEAKAIVERGAFAWVDGGRARTSTTHVGNLVHACELALAKGRGGEAYFVTDGVDTDFRSFLTRLLAAEGVELPERSMPGWLLEPAATLVEGVWRALRMRGAPPLTRHAVALLRCDCTLRIDKARRELGYEPRVGVEEGLRELAEARTAGGPRPEGAA